MTEIQQLSGDRPVAIVGAGLVGAGWAIVYARAGLAVKMFDANPQTTAKAIPLIEGQLAGLRRHGLVHEDPATILARITPVATLAEAVDGACYVQESVLERVDVKRQLMTDLDALAAPDLIVGSSTSGIPGSAFALGLGISPRVLIAHPVNPPYLVPVVELVPSAQTSAATVAFADALMRAVGQTVVHVRKEVEGFVLNRLQAVLLREAWALVQEGVASSEDIDKTVRDGLGWRWSFMGPFETIDLNAPGGVADYAARLGPLYQRIAESRTHEQPWDDELIRQVEAQRREHLAHAELETRRAWRDERLMEFAARRAPARTE
ncbi:MULTISPECIES: 3-hydroxyacyl-CoA dehydrogenase [Ramlibacter]|uniref:3-hydroxyacyl-CoA dehydrogenase n=1 Tax=Ramlibacter pinisoli TaxID=2682844 RepID=A0A6N8IW59_9BURK|nr:MULTISPECIES: 3-hydroxyacyl-CoA dehydrogenase [Ramlibacter]MBA2960956.1 3-hydroxyacyl-CoA dehydrogenase [Ramlibacter sp. CGMCC 1.13660]MVQ30902.1 3-hydroxyacyl-CoA dehydrogenase [Ramlibacter pinisoli]